MDMATLAAQLAPPQPQSGATNGFHKVVQQALVTKTVRKWAAGHNQENAATNEAAVDGSMLSSGMPSHLIAEDLINKGLKRRLTLGQSPTQFYNSITHLHLDGLGLTGNVEPIKLCLNLQVLYLFDNKLSSLSGLGSLGRLTHLYVQNNNIESLHDFTAPPALQQLYLNGNMLLEVRGLQEARCLTELHLAGQRRSTPAAASAPAAAEWALGAPPPPPPPPAPAPICFEQDSLFAVSSTLRKLDVSSCHLDDEAVELFVVFQELELLEMTRNALSSVDRLQQLVSRLPQLRVLKLAGNPVVSKAKFRERVILAASSLEQLDGKPVRAHERQFLMSMVLQAQSKGGGPRKPRGASAAARAPGERQLLSREGRPPSIDSRPSRPLDFQGLDGAAPPGMRPGTQPPVERGRGAALPNSRSAGSGARASRGY
jgi:protein phosphatase 1 regulatory subunit 42